MKSLGHLLAEVMIAGKRNCGIEQTPTVRTMQS